MVESTRPILSRRNCTTIIGWFAILSLTAIVASADESEFLQTHTKAIAANPKGVKFSIGIVGGRRQFHVGEVIPLEIVYEFEPGETLSINHGLCNDSGTARLLEVMHVSPHTGTRSKAWKEPNFHRWAGGTPLPPRDERVYRYRVALNEWRRFDLPGRYRLYSESARVWKRNVPHEQDNDLRLTSNVLELEIIPVTAEWQDDQVRAAVKILDLPIDDADDNVQQMQQRREALRILRYLDTESATRQLARRTTGQEDEESYEFDMALYQSKFKQAAVEELVRRLDSPDFMVTADFIRNLARLDADAQIPIEYSQFNGDPGSKANLEKLTAEHEGLEQKLLEKYSEAARLAAEKKNPLARARSLLERLPVWPLDYRRGHEAVSAEMLAQIRGAVIQEFQHLSPQEQGFVLGHQWKRLGSAEFVPTLRRFILDAPERMNNHDPVTLLDSAFQRLWELKPDDAYQLVLAELRRPKPRATIHTFRLLPAKPLPDLDALLTARLEHNDGDSYEDHVIAATVLARSGTCAVYDRIRAVYDDHLHYWDDLPAGLLAYILRHNPEEGTRLVNRAIDASKQRPIQSVLTDIADVQMSAELERIAIERLDDKDLNIASNAVSLLRVHGSTKGEQALWNRFEKWHAAWKDKITELENTNDAKTNRNDDLEYSLVYALSHAANWITDKDKLIRLRKLCLTKNNQEDVDQMLEEWRDPVPIRFRAGVDGEFPSAIIHGYSLPLPSIVDNWSVTQYVVQSVSDLHKLLARFPAGTTFGFPTGMLSDEKAEQAFFEDLQKSLETKGYKLVKLRPFER